MHRLRLFLHAAAAAGARLPRRCAALPSQAAIWCRCRRYCCCLPCCCKRLFCQAGRFRVRQQRGGLCNDACGRQLRNAATQNLVPASQRGGRIHILQLWWCYMAQNTMWGWQACSRPCMFNKS